MAKSHFTRIVLFVSFLFPGISNAELFTVEDVKLAFGKHCLGLYDDGLWKQEGGPLWWKAHRCDTSKSVGLGGHTFLEHIDWSFMYSNRGGFTGAGTFTDDENYINGNFIPIYSSEYRGETRSITFTLDPTYRMKKIDVIGKVGMQWYYAKLKFINTNIATGLQTMHHFSEIGAKPYTGLAIRYKHDTNASIYVECYRTHESPPESPNSGRSGCNLGVEVGF